jgi:peptide-methionine (R)-S-oxide reductase
VKQPFFNRLALIESLPFMPSRHIQKNISLPDSVQSLYSQLKKINQKSGVYRCASCQLLLFTSHTLIASGVGWASFRSPVSEKQIEIIRDQVLGFERQEIVCPNCRSHLGYLFEDGPEPTRRRYSVMLAALNFVPGK